MSTFKTGFVASLAFLALGGAAFAGSVDTIDATTGQPGTYFVPSLGQETDSPYYRNRNQDWSWTHNAIAGAAAASSIELNISAYDVDEAPCGLATADCEFDDIYGFDANSSSYVYIGTLGGADNAFSFTTFDLTGTLLADDVEAGLQVMIDIDANDTGFWLVSLSKSVITTDGEDPGNPDPGVVPLPAAGFLLLGGLGGMSVLRRRKKA